MIGVTAESARWLRAVPAGVKLAALAAISAGLFMLDGPVPLGAAFAASLLVAAAGCGVALLRGLRPIAWMLLFALVAHGVLGDWMLGLAVVFRIAALVLLASAVSASTELSDMLAVFDRLLAPLRWVGVPTRPAGIACVMALRFAPMLTQRWTAMSDAWRARSSRRVGWRLVTPFLLSALDDADGAANALAARGAFRRR